MKHAVLVALSLVALGCAGVEPVTVTPAQQPVAPAEVSLDARPSPPPPPQPQVVASAQPTPPAPPVAPTPTVLKGPLDQQEFGMIGLLGASGGGDALSAQGNMWGSEIGDSFGAGGLGLSGVGTGGGGRGEGIGIGSIG